MNSVRQKNSVFAKNVIYVLTESHGHAGKYPIPPNKIMKEKYLYVAHASKVICNSLSAAGHNCVAVAEAESSGGSRDGLPVEHEICSSRPRREKLYVSLAHFLGRLA